MYKFIKNIYYSSLSNLLKFIIISIFFKFCKKNYIKFKIYINFKNNIKILLKFIKNIYLYILLYITLHKWSLVLY